MSKRIYGIIPPIVTPFDQDGRIDESGLRDTIRFSLAKGVHGLCFGGSVSEGHTLEADELERVAEICVEEADGKVPVIAGIIVNSTREALERSKRVAKHGVDALQITPVHYIFKPDDEATYQHFKVLAESTDLPLLIYNVVPWNYISPQLLVRMMREIPNVRGVKQSAGDLKLFADLMITAPADAIIFSAVDALLYPAFMLGSKGTVAANPAAAPAACVALWDAVQAGDHALARRLHESLLRLWNAICGDNLCANVKFALRQQGVNAGLPRAPMPPTPPAQGEKIKAALKELEAYEPR